MSKPSLGTSGCAWLSHLIDEVPYWIEVGPDLYHWRCYCCDRYVVYQCCLLKILEASL